MSWRLPLLWFLIGIVVCVLSTLLFGNMWKRLANVFVRPLSSTTVPMSASARMLSTAATPVTGSSVAVTPYSVAYITVPNRAVADSLSKELVEKKLVACVNIIPGVRSVYWWDNKVNEDEELLLMMKTRTSVVPSIVEFVTAAGHHPYQTPEVISLPIQLGSAPYLEWIGQSVPAVTANNVTSSAPPPLSNTKAKDS